MALELSIEKRLEELSEKGDFLEKINHLVDFEIFLYNVHFCPF